MSSPTLSWSCIKVYRLPNSMSSSPEVSNSLLTTFKYHTFVCDLIYLPNKCTSSSWGYSKSPSKYIFQDKQRENKKLKIIRKNYNWKWFPCEFQCWIKKLCKSWCVGIDIAIQWWVRWVTWEGQSLVSRLLLKIKLDEGCIGRRWEWEVRNERGDDDGKERESGGWEKVEEDEREGKCNAIEWDLDDAIFGEWVIFEEMNEIECEIE